MKRLLVCKNEKRGKGTWGGCCASQRAYCRILKKIGTILNKAVREHTEEISKGYAAAALQELKRVKAEHQAEVEDLLKSRGELLTHQSWDMVMDSALKKAADWDKWRTHCRRRSLCCLMENRAGSTSIWWVRSWQRMVLVRCEGRRRDTKGIGSASHRAQFSSLLWLMNAEIGSKKVCVVASLERQLL